MSNKKSKPCVYLSLAGAMQRSDQESCASGLTGVTLGGFNRIFMEPAYSQIRLHPTGPADEFIISTTDGLFYYGGVYWDCLSISAERSDKLVLPFNLEATRGSSGDGWEGEQTKKSMEEDSRAALVLLRQRLSGPPLYDAEVVDALMTAMYAGADDSETFSVAVERLGGDKATKLVTKAKKDAINAFKDNEELG